MAQNAPPSQDVQDIQFKLHDKFNILAGVKELKSLVNLLAVSSVKGLLFAGNPDGKELKVFKLKEIVDAKITGQEPKVRLVSLPGEIKSLASSCDGSMLAVHYVLNNTGFLQVYQVDSFLTTAINSLYNLPVAPECNVHALQLLWNPVIPNNIALVLSDGSVAMYTLNNGGQYDKHTLGKEHQVKSGCWSPKGKQIVFGFAEGKLQQFKPNLQPARAIPCPPGIHPGPFDCIAVHWLSTFQFAAIFLQRGQDMCPSLFIVNAPKTGQTSYINYYDICYSAPGPRTHQLTFTHISQWNLLLVTSANGVEVGVLGTKELGENPNWVQYTLLDEARVEMPLTESKDETYPMGFAYDTASSHQVAIGEKKLPVMPMVHVLSTYGHLVSYNFLNLTPNAVDVCSPPPPLNDTSGQFKVLSETMSSAASNPTQTQAESNKHLQTAAENKPQATGQSFGDLTFTLGSNVVTSTPSAKDKQLPLFGTQTAAAKPSTGFGFPANTASSTTATVPTATTVKPTTGFGFSTAPQQFGSITAGTSFGGLSGTGFNSKPSDVLTSQQPSTQTVNLTKNPEVNKPLYTVPATFTPPAVQQSNKVETKPIKTATIANKINFDAEEIDEVVKQMIAIQIEAFETELKQIRMQSKQMMENIGSPDEIKPFTKQLNHLQEIIEQANDHEFEQDVQSLRHSMNESYAMLAECRTKLDLYNNPNLTRLSTVPTSNPTNRRQLTKLQAYVASNQNQLSQLNQLLEAQWSQYQDVVRRNSKNKMHIPCLDGIYQRMSKLKDLLARQRNKMNYIKTKLKQKGLNYKPSDEIDIASVAVGVLTKNRSTMESLADSILSMSLSQVVSQTHAKLSEEKLNAIRSFAKQQQQISIIKPKRPDRIDLKSEVILETKLETERKQKELVKKQQQKQQQQYVQQQQQQYIKQQQQYLQQQQQQFVANKIPLNLQQKSQTATNYQTQLQQPLIKPQPTMPQQQQPPIIAKPTASKPSIVTSQPPSFITPASSAAVTLSFGGNSSFVKTSQSISVPKSEELSKQVVTTTPFTGFGTTPTAINYAQAKSVQAITSASNDSKENPVVNTPISFAAKVIGGNDKPFANLGNKVNTANMVSPALSSKPSGVATSSGGFSAFATTKPLSSTTSNQAKDENKKLDEAPKHLDFSRPTAGTALTTQTIQPTTSTPFAEGTKSTASTSATTSLPFSGLSFGSNAAIATPFGGQPFSSSSFSFNAPVSVPLTAGISVANTFTKTISTTTTLPITATAKPAENKTALTSAASTTTTPASSSSPGTDNIVSSKSQTAPNVTITSSGLPEPKPASKAPTLNSAPLATAANDPTDSLFGTLNICKPTAKVAGDSDKPANIFSGFVASTSTATSGAFSFASVSGTEGGKSSVITTTTTATTPSTGFSFIAASSTPVSATGNIFGKSTTETSSSNAATTTTVPAQTLSTTSSVVASSSSTAPATGTSSFSFGTAATSSLPTAGSLFGSLTLSSTPTASTTSTTTTVGNIFGGGTSAFGQTGMAATTTSTTTPLFGGGATVTSSAPSLFGSTAPTETPAAIPGTGSVFGAAATSASPQSAGSIFGGIPKPEQSVFGTGLFATAAASTKAPAAAGGSIFGGGGSSGFSSSTGGGGSIFGGGSTSTSPFSTSAIANNSGSIFGAAAATATKPAEGGNIFGSPTQQSASSGGSLFGKNTFGTTTTSQSPGNIFGGSSAQAPTSSVFGASGGSIFNSASTNTATSGGSLFGAASAATGPTFGATTGTTGFGSFSPSSTAPPFGSPSSGGGTFGTATSTTFGSPQQQSAFSKPVFGGPATFGSPTPAFGAQPTFGGAPTFGSPKGFGAFGATSPTTTGFGAAPQPSAAAKGNIFETLGSQESGLSFGNLAHSTQTPQPKSPFGGSSFMNYRS